MNPLSEQQPWRWLKKEFWLRNCLLKIGMLEQIQLLSVSHFASCPGSPSLTVCFGEMPTSGSPPLRSYGIGTGFFRQSYGDSRHEVELVGPRVRRISQPKK